MRDRTGPQTIRRFRDVSPMCAYCEDEIVSTSADMMPVRHTMRFQNGVPVPLHLGCVDLFIKQQKVNSDG